MLTLLLAAAALGADPRLPNHTYTPDQRGTRISAPFGGREPYNQPTVVNGHLLLAGNGHFELFDVSDPFRPVFVSAFDSAHARGEAESHQVAQVRTADGRTRLVTISGKGVDLWDLTHVAAPDHLAHVTLEGIDYGDNSEAVWGVAWQGDVLWVGGTNTGLHVVDVSDPRAPARIDRLPTSALGGVSAGPLWAVGNLLVVTTPKEHAGIVTLDISDPWAPALLDHVVPEVRSYIGGFFGTNAYLLTPFRVYDVTTDPSDIRLLESHPTPAAEYLAFGDDHLFLGAMRPNPGAFKVDLSRPFAISPTPDVPGRSDGPDRGVFTDDQFVLPIANALVLCDDEISFGCVVAVHDHAPDDRPPAVAYVDPPDGAAGQALTTRVGLSFTDQIDLRSVDADTFVLRPVGGAPLAGDWALDQTVLGFAPAEPLLPDTTYEIVLPAGGVHDLAGNPLAVAFSSVFSTGDAVAAVRCRVDPTTPVAVGEAATLSAGAVEGATYTWDLGGRTVTGRTAEATWDTPGRRAVTLTVEADGLARSCAAVQVVHRPLAPTPPTASSSLVVSGPHALVVHPDAGTVAAVHRASRTVAWEVPAGARPRSLAVLDDEVWVVDQDGDALVILDAATGDLRDTVALPWGARPFGIAPAGRHLHVTLEGRAALLTVDARAREVIATLPLPAGPRGVAVAPDGRVWVTRYLSPEGHGELWVIDPAKGRVVDTVVLPLDPGPDDHDQGRGVPNVLSTVTISPDGARAAVPAKKDDVVRGLVRDGEELDADNTVRAIVSLVDVAARTEPLEERVDLDDQSLPVAAAFSPLGDLVFVAVEGSNRVTVLDAYDGRRVASFGTGLAPGGLALDDAGVLWVRDDLSRTVSAFDVTGLLDGTDAFAARLGQVVTAAEEPLPAAVLLGKQIFHNAGTREMSQDGYLSCATCHPDGGTDARVWDFTQRGEGLRDTIDLRGKAGTGHGLIHWSGNFDEVQDFEADIRLHQGGGGLLDDDAWDLHADPLGAPKAGLSERLDALAAYVATLDTFPRSPHREEDGSLTPDARAGARLFQRLDCLDCHSGDRLTDSSLTAPVRHDVGTLRQTSGTRLGGPLDGLDTPTLHGLHATAPYLHDGSAATLREVLDRPDHGSATRLTDRQKVQLEAFLLSLDGEVPVPAAACGCATGRAGAPAAALLLALACLRRRAAPGRRGPPPSVAACERSSGPATARAVRRRAGSLPTGR